MKPYRLLLGLLSISVMLLLMHWLFRPSSSVSSVKTDFGTTKTRAIRSTDTHITFQTSLQLSQQRKRDDEKVHENLATEGGKVGRLTVGVVTAFSENHVEESVDMIASLQSYSPASTIIVYNLGINNSSLEKLKSFCNVEIRTFPFHRYGRHFRNLEVCAWKPIIVQEVLGEFPIIFYGDASIRLTRDIGNVLQLVQTGSPIVGQSTAPSGPAGSYTHDGTLAFFNISRDQYKDVDMFAATYFVMKQTPVVDTIVQQWVLCAMDPGCISPLGAHKWPCLTNLQEMDHNAFIGCHRYDQSALSIILFKVLGRSGYNGCIQESSAHATVAIHRYKTNYNMVHVCH